MTESGTERQVMKMGFNMLDLMNDKSKQAAVEPQVQEREKEEIVYIDVEDLVPSEDNFYQTDRIEELARSIELLGKIEQPVLVKPPVHGKYEVNAGHRRRLAVMLLVKEGKEEYRKVPCIIKRSTETFTDKLRLILTNSTAREISDYDKMQQVKEMKELLIDYKVTLDERIKESIKEGDFCRGCEYCVGNEEEGYTCQHEHATTEEKMQYTEAKGKDCPYYKKYKLGRIREIVADMLNTSTTQIGRLEQIESNLTPQFKEEMQKGNINISTAHELSKLPEDKQQEAFSRYEEKGKLQIKDVKQEEPEEEISEELEEAIRLTILKIIVGPVNFDIFKNPTDEAHVCKCLYKNLAKTYKGGKVETTGGIYIYRLTDDSLTLQDSEWQNKLISFEALAKVIVAMAAVEELEKEPLTPNGIQETIPGVTPNPIREKEDDTEEDTEEEETGTTEQIPGQQDLTENEEYLPDVTERGLDFATWLERRYAKAPANIIRETIEHEFRGVPTDTIMGLEENTVNAVTNWFNKVSEEYKLYLLSE